MRAAALTRQFGRHVPPRPALFPPFWRRLTAVADCGCQRQWTRWSPDWEPVQWCDGHRPQTAGRSGPQTTRTAFGERGTE
jgi:hypothetical protein